MPNHPNCTSISHNFFFVLCSFLSLALTLKTLFFANFSNNIIIPFQFPKLPQCHITTTEANKINILLRESGRKKKGNLRIQRPKRQKAQENFTLSRKIQGYFGQLGGSMMKREDLGESPNGVLNDDTYIPRVLLFSR